VFLVCIKNSEWLPLLNIQTLCIKRSKWSCGTKKKWSYKTGDLLKEFIHMKFSMTGHEKGDLLIQVTA